MKATTTYEGFRCEITDNGMRICSSEEQCIYSERFKSLATGDDVHNLISQFILIVSMRRLRTSENRETIKRVIYYGDDLAQMQIIKDMFTDDWIAMFFDSSLNYMRELRLEASEVHDYVERFVPVKGIPGYVFRSSLGDCTNKGISSDHDRLSIVSDDGWSVLTDIRECVTVERRIIGHSEYVNVKPVYKADRWYMSGGNFLFSSDARFKKATGVDYPVAIHDRYED